MAPSGTPKFATAIIVIEPCDSTFLVQSLCLNCKPNLKVKTLSTAMKDQRGDIFLVHFTQKRQSKPLYNSKYQERVYLKFGFSVGFYPSYPYIGKCWQQCQVWFQTALVFLYIHCIIPLILRKAPIKIFFALESLSKGN